MIELISNKSAAKILIFFLRHQTIQINLSEIIKKTGLAKGTALKWLDILIKNKALKFIKFGRTKVYSLNRENEGIKQLKKMDTLSLISEIKDLAAKNNLKAYLYGSAARGEDVEDSDIDILIIGKIKKEEIINEIKKISEKIRKKIKIEIFTEQGWSEMARKDPAFYERVEKDKIELKE
jgi:predicted nucleotidyltransferase